MKPAPKLKKLIKVRELLKERLKETKHSAAELAEVAEVPTDYIESLLSGRRRAPLPARTDIYEKVTRFLGLGRTDLADCAKAERTGKAVDEGAPDPEIRRLLLELCEPETARKLERKGKKDDEQLIDLIARVLDVVQGSARRVLDDQIALRIASARNGVSYIDTRLKVLEFLDATPATLTDADFMNFVRPRISLWDVDFDTGVLRVVLRATESPENNRRRPLTRTGRMRLAG